MKIGFIGCGNMGAALIDAAMKCSCAELIVADKDEERLYKIKEKYGAKTGSNKDVAAEADVVFLAVKPNVVRSVAEELKDALKPGGLVVSMAAGVQLKVLDEILGERSIIRIMPNTPVAVGEGMITFARNSGVSDENVKLFTEILAYAGRLDEVPESVIDAATAVAGCGPAFVYMFAEALADAGVFCGLTREKAITYAAQTIKGAASMMLKTDKHPAKLRDEVCSPGGSTIVGVHALEDGGFRAAVEGAVIKAYKKTKELG